MGPFLALSCESARKPGSLCIDIKRGIRRVWPKYAIFWPDLGRTGGGRIYLILLLLDVNPVGFRPDLRGSGSWRQDAVLPHM